MNHNFSDFLSTFICSFVLLVSSIFGIALFARSLITKYRRRETKKMRSWVELAQSHRLAMAFDKDSRDGAYIEGDFRGHHLKLETFQRDTVSEVSKTYTCLTLSINESIHQKEEKSLSLETISQGFVSVINSSELNTTLKGRISVDKDDQVIRYEQEGVEEDAKYLSFLFDLMNDIAEVYFEIVELGGETVSLLQPIAVDKNNKFQGVVRHLLQDIGKDTTDRLADQAERLLCARCLTKCTVHQLKLSSLETISYYGCRACQQSREFIEWEGMIVVRLDRNMATDRLQQNGSLQINWLRRGELFDFDKIEIGTVTDEEVERFAVKVGNDTDPIRKTRYKKMPCEIGAPNTLSENTIKILKYLFDKAEIR